MSSLVLPVLGLGFGTLTRAQTEPVKYTPFAQGSGSYSVEKLATDAIGSMTLLLTNVAPGSAIRLETQVGGATVYAGTASSSTVTINVPVYSAGNPGNDLRVKVRKGTASPFYQPWETLTAAEVGSTTIYVSQIPDE